MNIFGPPGNNDIHFLSDELGNDLGGALAATLRPAILDGDVATLDPAEFSQSLHKSGSPSNLHRRRDCAQEPDGRQFSWLLRARRERPRHSRAAEQRNELATFDHSITSSAATSRPGGTVRPSVFAVFRLTTVSNLVAACTGRSAGLSPRRMRST